MQIVILTGAGISAESGLGTFRDTDGLWATYDIEDVATPQGFARNPGLVHDFYNARRATCRAARPNAAHLALARLQAAMPGHVTIVTQNVDDLHQRAGSDTVIQMHGALLRALCATCGHRWDAPVHMYPEDVCPSCARSTTRPDVVWFGEIPYQMDDIAALVEQATHFAAIGTSGQVWPAAGLVAAAKQVGATCHELNLEPSEMSADFDHRLYGPATRVVPEWVAALIKSAS